MGRTGHSNAQADRQRVVAGYRANTVRNVIGNLDDVLDIGAGFGLFLDACRSSGAKNYYGFEPGFAQRRYAEETLNLVGHVAAEELSETTNVPFRPRIVTLFHVLEHFADPGLALDQIAALMAADGWLVIEVPDLQMHNWSRMGVMSVHVSHRTYFTLASLQDLLARHGFSIVKFDQEVDGIYPGNLRVFARLSRVADATTKATNAAAMAREIRREIAPFRLLNGYVRAAVRLLRIALDRPNK